MMKLISGNRIKLESELIFMNKIGFFGKITKSFLKNKQLAILTIIAILFWGVLSFILMPKQYNPEITAPAFNIVTQFEGATSEEVHELVTRPMENKVKEVPTVDKVMSQSLDGGTSIVTVQFFIGENIEDAKISLMQKLASNMDFKPMGANDPFIKEINPEDVPIVVFALTSEYFNEDSLRKIAWDLGDEVKHIKGVSKIEVKGGKLKNIIIEIDQLKLTSFNISINEIINLVENNNTRKSIGSIEGEDLNFRVTVDGNIKSVEDAEKLVIKNIEGKKVYLSDVANIYYDHGKVENFVRFSDKEQSREAVYLAISKKEGSNATTVSKNILEELDRLQKNNSNFQYIDIETVRDDGRIAGESVFKLTTNLFVAIAIVSFILFLFLGWRSALVVSLSIPLTLAAVFGMGNLFGQSVNRITLFALILSLGLLVDNATVIVENIYRLLRKKKDENKEKVIVEAVDEVGSGLAMSTLTTILAFIPMAFVTGMMGPYMGPIPFFVPVALLASLLIAITINPFLVNIFIKTKENQNNTEEKKKQNLFIVGMEKLKNKYGIILKSLIHNKRKRKFFIAIIISAFLLSMTMPLFGLVKFRMLPKDDKEQFYIYVDLPNDFSIEKTNDISRKIEELALEQEEVKSVQSFVGESQIIDFNGLFKGSSGRNNENQATFKINLTHPKERRASSEDVVLTLRSALDDFIFGNPDVVVKFIEDPPGPPVLSTFLIKVQGEDEMELQKIVRDIEDKLYPIKGVVDIDDTISERSVEYVFEVNKEKASDANINSMQIVSALDVIFGEKKVGLFHQKESDASRKPEQEFIIVNFQKDNKNEEIDINKIFISNNQGEKIPVSELITKKESGILPIIYSDEFKRTHYISAEMENRGVVYAVIDAFRKIVDYKLPSGKGEISSISLLGLTYKDMETGKSYDVLFDGEWKLTLEVFRDLGLAMAIAIFMIYFVLVFQFKSLKIPLLVMGTIPLAMIGVMPGFAFLGLTSGMFFNATSMIGVIALAGIVVNNAIILLEYIKEMNEYGLEIEEALLEAGKTRFLPIVLTSMTTILGSLTIISDPVWSGLAWAIIWGLSMSAFLTLIVFPIFYYISERKNW